ncbi:hypothetical protein LBMAG42_09960 [Deltaproteobacteria bacterium]|nr:hypothetical protein LBMAG42_09960 [Deltaproteobacteria bacterium]
MPLQTPSPTPLDVLVIGGGPAGATLASILLRHRPQSRVRIVERETFPRFHVGETLVSDINLVLDEMGAYEAVAAAGFVKKYGATFRWGLSPEPWHMIFASLDELRPVDAKGVQTAFTWHVDRAVYDTILLDNARALGAEVVVGAVRSLLEAEGRVVGVRMEDGTEHHARFVVDATGQAGLCGSLADRVVDPHLQNIAAWGYFRGFHFEPELNGTWESSRAFIVAHEYGWSWYFPIRPDLVSVGVVMHRDDLQGDRPDARFAAAIQSCPELSRLLHDATLVPYAEGAPLVHVIRDYSYLSSSIVRPGFARVGDAAGFVDPILSVGCFLGQSGARILAYGLRTLLGGDPRLDEATVLGAYADHVLDTLRAFREVTWFFYRFNERPDAWWGEARRQVADAGFPSQAHDRHAFTAFATGFAARRSVFREPNGMFGEPFFEDAFRRLVNPAAAPPPPSRPRLKSSDRPRLLGRAELRASAVPVDGSGRMIPALRVEVHTPAAHGGDALVRRLFVPRSMAPLFAWLDGNHDLASLVRRLDGTLHLGIEHEPALVRYVRGVVEGLVERGLAER